nr:hypothetical protein [Streptomyces sp. TLI_55]
MVSAIRTGVIFSRIASIASHSIVVKRSGSKYAGEYKANIRPRSNAAFIFAMKLSPAPQSQQSKSTSRPASRSCQAIHSAHARSAPA